MYSSVSKFSWSTGKYHLWLKPSLYNGLKIGLCTLLFCRGLSTTWKVYRLPDALLLAKNPIIFLDTPAKSAWKRGPSISSVYIGWLAHHVCALGRLSVLESIWWSVKSRGPEAPVEPARWRKSIKPDLPNFRIVIQFKYLVVLWNPAVVRGSFRWQTVANEIACHHCRSLLRAKTTARRWCRQYSALDECFPSSLECRFFPNHTQSAEVWILVMIIFFGFFEASLFLCAYLEFVFIERPECCVRDEFEEAFLQRLELGVDSLHEAPGYVQPTDRNMWIKNRVLGQTRSYTFSSKTYLSH